MTNRSYRLRKGFSEKEGVEEVDFKKVNRIPERMEASWKYRIDRQEITGYHVGDRMSLVVFDYREGEYSYWADFKVGFNLELHKSEAEEVFGFLNRKED